MGANAVALLLLCSFLLMRDPLHNQSVMILFDGRYVCVVLLRGIGASLFCRLYQNVLMGKMDVVSNDEDNGRWLASST